MLFRSLKHLEDEGYVVRVTDDDDKRAARVYLSEKGNALKKENYDRFVAVDNEMMAGFTAEETELLRSMLLRIRDNLEKPKGREE